MGEFARLYFGSPDIFYRVLSQLAPCDLKKIATSSRLMVELIWNGKYRNLWLEWWKRERSEVVLPIGCLQTLRREVYQTSLYKVGMNGALADGFDKVVRGMELSTLGYWNMAEVIDDGYLEIVRLVTEYDRSLVDDMSTNAARRGRLDILEYLLSRGGRIITYHIIRTVPVLECVLRHGLIVDDKLIHSLIERDRHELMRYLLDHQLIRADHNNHGTFLMAIRCSGPEMVSHFLQYGANPCHNGYRPLLEACRNRTYRNLKILLLAIADPSVKNYNVITRAHCEMICRWLLHRSLSDEIEWLRGYERLILETLYRSVSSEDRQQLEERLAQFERRP